MQKLSQEQMEERRANFAALHNNPALDELFTELRNNYVERLVTEQVGSLTANTLHASIRVLAEVRSVIRNEAEKRLTTLRR